MPTLKTLPLKQQLHHAVQQEFNILSDDTPINMFEELGS